MFRGKQLYLDKPKSNEEIIENNFLNILIYRDNFSKNEIIYDRTVGKNNLLSINILVALCLTLIIP